MKGKAASLTTGRRKLFLEGGFLTAGAGAIWAPMIVVFSSFFPSEKTVYATSLIALLCSLGQMAATIVLVGVRLPRTESGSRRDVLIPSFANAVCQLGCWAVLYGFLPLLARQLGAGQVVISLLLAGALAANTVSTLVVTLAARRGRTRLILHASFFLFAAGILVAAIARSIPFLFVATLAMGGANGFFFPLLMGLSIEQVDGAHRSTAMGIHQAVYAVGMFLGPWIGGVIADAVGIRWMFGAVAGFCFVAANLLIRFQPRRLQTPGASATLAAEAGGRS